MKVIGVDPGQEGGITVLEIPHYSNCEESVILLCIPMPVIKYELTTKTKKGNKKYRTEIDLESIRRQIFGRVLPSECIAYLEEVAARPEQGVTSMFNFGCGFGSILGFMVAYLGKDKVHKVRPQTWKKDILAGMDRSEKSSSIQKALELSNGASSFKRTPKCKKFHDGMTDSYLIARYGWEEERLKIK